MYFTLLYWESVSKLSDLERHMIMGRKRMAWIFDISLCTKYSKRKSLLAIDDRVVVDHVCLMTVDYQVRLFEINVKLGCIIIIIKLIIIIIYLHF